MADALTPQQVPYTGPYSLPTGPHRARGPTALALKRMCKRFGSGFQDKEFSELDEHYNEPLEAALDKAIPGMDGYGQKRWEACRKLKVPAGRPNAGQFALDSYAQELIRDEAASQPAPGTVPDLGPMFAGGKSVLRQDLTHATTGIPDYPAFDDAFTVGTSIVAPEDLEVTAQSSANPGDAFYATGASKLKYWFGHLDRAPATGAKIKKGVFMAKVAPNSIGGGPHVHVAIDARPLIGKVLEHHTNYTHGAPTVGEQLEKALV